MNLEQKIMEQLKVAMKTKDEVALRTLRAIKAAILLEKTSEGFTGELTEQNELALLQKMAKQRKESLAIFLEKGREDLAKNEQDELNILQHFLPEELSDEELKTLIQTGIEELQISSIKDMGKLMAWSQKTVNGRADGKRISEAVKSLLSAIN